MRYLDILNKLETSKAQSVALMEENDAFQFYMAENERLSGKIREIVNQLFKKDIITSERARDIESECIMRDMKRPYYQYIPAQSRRQVNISLSDDYAWYCANYVLLYCEWVDAEYQDIGEPNDYNEGTNNAPKWMKQIAPKWLRQIWDNREKIQTLENRIADFDVKFIDIEKRISNLEAKIGCNLS